VHDISTVWLRAEVKRVVLGVLMEAGLVPPPVPPTTSRRRSRKHLRVVPPS
jgi:hypothetical protein